MQINQTQIEVVRGSVLEQVADAIVNAANKGMRGGSALDGAIHHAAGPQMLAELVEIAPHGARTAEVVVTRAYDLPQSWVFHVAGPIWKAEAEEECEEALAPKRITIVWPRPTCAVWNRWACRRFRRAFTVFRSNAPRPSRLRRRIIF